MVVDMVMDGNGKLSLAHELIPDGIPHMYRSVFAEQRSVTALLNKAPCQGYLTDHEDFRINTIV